MSGQGKFWSDGFDMDLLAVVPDAKEIVGQVADMPLYVHGGTTHGRLNHPSVWNDYEHGMVAFFSVDPRVPCKPESHYSGDPIVECTTLEAFRDAWPHHYALTVDGRLVWDTLKLQGLFDRIMYHRRGWRTLPDAQFEANLAHLREELKDASSRLILEPADD